MSTLGQVADVAAPIRDVGQVEYSAAKGREAARSDIDAFLERRC